jgi:hypothetical protein
MLTPTVATPQALAGWPAAGGKAGGRVATPRPKNRSPAVVPSRPAAPVAAAVAAAAAAAARGEGGSV